MGADQLLGPADCVVIDRRGGRVLHRVLIPDRCRSQPHCPNRAGRLEKRGRFRNETAMAETENSAQMQPDSTLDAKGLLCPLPVLKARRALKSVPAGGILEVLATDPGATKDFEHFCRTTGCELIEATEAGGGLRFRLEKPL